MVDILYEDNHVIVCYKEKGILSQGDGSSTPDMLTIIKEYLVKKYNKPGDAYLGLVHRLDRNTSGVMVFAKTSKAASRLNNSIINREFKKKYLAIVEGIPKKNSDTLTDNLFFDEKIEVSKISPSGKLSVLSYKVLGQTKINGMICSYVLVDLKTGRHHQIRCQLANIGHPLYGDIKYGSRQNNHFDLPLQAYYLAFPHPITKELLEFKKVERKGFFSSMEEYDI